MAAIPIPSFAHRVLLSKPVLDLLVGTDYQERRIQGVADSVLESLNCATGDPFSNLPIAPTLVNRIKRCVRVPARVLIVACVLCCISPLGAVTHGSVALGHFAFSNITPDSNTADQERQKAYQYARAFFADTSLFIVGVVLTTTLTMSVIVILNTARLSTFLLGVCEDTIIDSIVLITCSSLLIFGSSYLLGGFSPETQFPLLLTGAHPELRVGMYLALAFRRLGLVDKTGALLPFSHADTIEYEERRNGHRIQINFEGACIERFKTLIEEAQMGLLDQVRRVNQLLQAATKPTIKFEYPFDVDKVVQHLENAFFPTSNGGSFPAIEPLSDNQKDVRTLIKDLRRLAKREEELQELYYRALRVASDDSVPLQILKSICGVGISGPIQKIPYRLSWRFAYTYFRVIPDPNTSSFEIPFDAVNPESLEDQAYTTAVTYEAFKLRLQIYKFNTEGKSLPWLLGLQENYTPEDLRVRCKKWALALHPDKNPGREEEAGELFKIYQHIIQQLGV